ncbi:MAG: PilZ domain-containing protein, partial [Planctomycetota bacterium]
MEQRAFKRIPSDVKASFFCNKTDYIGTITDISENGMYIKTEKI